MNNDYFRKFITLSADNTTRGKSFGTLVVEKRDNINKINVSISNVRPSIKYSIIFGKIDDKNSCFANIGTFTSDEFGNCAYKCTATRETLQNIELSEFDVCIIKICNANEVITPLVGYFHGKKKWREHYKPSDTIKKEVPEKPNTSVYEFGFNKKNDSNKSVNIVRNAPEPLAGVSDFVEDDNMPMPRKHSMKDDLNAHKSLSHENDNHNNNGNHNDHHNDNNHNDNHNNNNDHHNDNNHNDNHNNNDHHNDNNHNDNNNNHNDHHNDHNHNDNHNNNHNNNDHHNDHNHNDNHDNNNNDHNDHHNQGQMPQTKSMQTYPRNFKITSIKNQIDSINKNINEHQDKIAKINDEIKNLTSEKDDVTYVKSAYKDLNLLPTSVEDIFDKGMEVLPFISRGKEVEWVSIDFTDLVLIDKNAKFVKNPYFINSYKKYSHFILGKCIEEGRTVYLVGVPDFFEHDSEEYIRNMGFIAFKESNLYSYVHSGYYITVL